MIQFKQKFEVVVIGASAGGIDALEIILSSMTSSFQLPIAIVLHIPASEPSLLAEIFESKTSLFVKEAEANEVLQRGTVYFAPSSYHLVIDSKKSFQFDHGEPVLFSKPSIDTLFISAAEAYGDKVLGILLTGASHDGAMGLKKIKEAGGMTIIQDPINAKFSVMPASGMPYVEPSGIMSLAKIANFLHLSTIGPRNLPGDKIIAPKNSKLEILIVDDTQDNLIALKALLSRDDLDIFQSNSGTGALELMMKHDFCLALLDVKMPDMNGFELAELMRGSNKTKHIPIIFVTEVAKDEGHVFRGYESGAVDFLKKPIDPRVVKSKVNVFLELHQQKIELKEQVEELNKTKFDLEHAVRMREEFMSIAGHELKTPLTSLKLQTQMRKRSLDQGKLALFEPDKLATMFESDNKQLSRLTRLIDDMLDISRISSGRLSIYLEKFDLCHVIHEVIERNIEQFKAAGIKIDVHPCEPIFGRWDKLRIEQVITNLLTNAIKYGAGKPIEVFISNVENNAIIVIEDKGLGISEQDLSRIFLRFERATEKSEVSGLGLGLYIVSQIIEAHKGSIDVVSTLGIGSAFTIKLPLDL